jgi:hypothetical protein
MPSIDFSFILYIFLVFVVGLGLFRNLSSSGRTVSAIITLILCILIFIFFGLRWFRDTKAVGGYKGQWPPIINMCPDYLVYYKRASGQDTCVDLLGVSTTGTLKPWSEDDQALPPADESKYFPHVYRPGMSAAELNRLCSASKDAGLTWEGIFNGDGCSAIAIA